MKNLSLLIILITLTTFAYFISNENKNVIKDVEKIESIKTDQYELKRKSKKLWISNNISIDPKFIKTYLDILSSLELSGASDYKGETFGELKLFYNENKEHYILGEKVFSNNGIYLKVNSKWFIVKLNYTKDIIYKNDNDLALKQYDILYNIFNFSKELILKNRANKP